MPRTKTKKWVRILKFGSAYNSEYTETLSFLTSWSSKELAFFLEVPNIYTDCNNFVFVYHRPWPVLERFFGGFYNGVEKPSLGFVVLNEIDRNRWKPFIKPFCSFIYRISFFFFVFIWYTIPWYLKTKTLKQVLQLVTLTLQFNSTSSNLGNLWLYNWIFIINSSFRLCVKRKLPSSMKLNTENIVNWAIEMFSFSARMRGTLTTNLFQHKLIPYK